MSQTQTQTQTHPLSLMMPVIPGILEPAELTAVLLKAQDQLNAALTKVGTVHFARFLLLDASQPNLMPPPLLISKGPYIISVITEYDGDFDAYIQDFVDQLGAVFDAMLAFVVGGQELVPVAKNAQAFAAFVKKNDLSQQGTNQGLYAAYPHTVQEILAAFS